jgi:hypothetical protein
MCVAEAEGATKQDFVNVIASKGGDVRGTSVDYDYDHGAKASKNLRIFLEKYRIGRWWYRFTAPEEE